MPGQATALALLLAQGAVGDTAEFAPPAEPIEADVVQAQSDGEKRMTIPVSLEGQGPFRFLIDTGSQRTVVSTALAGRLGLVPGPSVRIIGVAGADIVETALVDTIGLGRRRYSDMTVPLLQEEHMGAEGIVGTDSLQHQRVLIDFGNDVIEIGDARSLGGNRGYEIVVTARLRSGQLVVTDANLDGIRVSVIVDTGAGTSVGNRALQRALNKRRGAGQMVTLQSVTGQSISAELGLARKLSIDSVGITNLVIAFTDTPAFAELELADKPALFLGMRELRLFERVAIDFRQKKVMFDLPRAE